MIEAWKSRSIRNAGLVELDPCGLSVIRVGEEVTQSPAVKIHHRVEHSNVELLSSESLDL